MDEFLNLMREQLGSQFESFLKSREISPQKAIRVNTLKISVEEFKRLSPFPLSPSPFSEEGFLIGDDLKIGKHPYHHAGLYYSQEPSASSVVSALLPYFKGNRVLDLCAAPGGKSTQIACHLPQNGILVSNEIVLKRAQVLSSNIERMGVKNCMVINNSPEEIANIFPEYFHAVIVDAPCSGEGMFRKNPDAAVEWSAEHVHSCAKRQTEILRSAAKTLAVGGCLVYSTCTYNTFENEGVIDAFLSEHDFSVLPVSADLKARASDGLGKFKAAMRIYPHNSAGEGHFVCLLRKNYGDINEKHYPFPYLAPTAEQTRLFKKQLASHFNFEPANLRCFSDRYYDVSVLPYNSRLRVLKAGVTLAEQARDRLLPHHNFATAFCRNTVKNTIDFPSDSPQIAAFLRGETVTATADIDGYGILKTDGFPLSIVKYSDGTLKNHYPKGLRNLT